MHANSKRFIHTLPTDRIISKIPGTQYFDHQLYLDHVTINTFRVALSKLKVSSHRLEIEVGGWSRPNRTPIDDKKCRICDKLKDEFHFFV